MTVTLPQHLEALDRANAIRMARAAVKRDIQRLTCAEGRLRVCELIMEPGDLWDAAKLGYVLRMPDRTGPRFVTRMLHSGRQPLSPLKTVGSLTERQRVELCAAIRGEQ